MNAAILPISLSHFVTRAFGVAGAMLLGFFSCAAFGTDAQTANKPCVEKLFTFSWQFQTDCGLKPRGGTSRGAALQLASEPSPGWLALQEPGLSDFEKDRRAILAMVGAYRTSFDFIETVGYTPQYKPDPPYQSWGTEYIYLVEDRGDFISLQHIMVMQYAEDAGTASGPFVQKSFVQKHWRQDWQYQARELLTYAGNDHRQQQRYSRSAVKGKWAQKVFQVDDSPRYEALSRWQHFTNYSTWLSEETWRPLPRRESSFRKDYQVLIGTNRHTITPTGWVQEEENIKTVLDANGKPAKEFPYLSKELGLARYEQLQNFDFSAGDLYWSQTGAFWRDVRSAWQTLAQQHEHYVLQETVSGVPLFMALFEAANKAASATAYDSQSNRAAIDAIIQRHVTVIE